MNDIYLTVNEVAELKKCSIQYIRKSALNGDIKAEMQINENNRPVYKIPLSALTVPEQRKYYKSKNIAIPDELLPKRQQKKEQNNKSFDEFNAEEREEIANWIRILKEWQEFCDKSKLQKVPATIKFCEMQKVVNPDLNISKSILYRKMQAYKEDDLAGLIDNRGHWKKGKSTISATAWECFMYFYLDERQYTIQACRDYTEMWLRQENRFDLLPLPSYAAFYRKVQNEIPEPLEVLGRQGEKAFRDRCAPYIKRKYENMASNDFWIADTHTFDVMTKDENGKVHRLYLSAFFDARSGIFTGCYVASSASSNGTLNALRKAIKRRGIPNNIYVDNGREFLNFDVGGLGHRQKKSTKDKFAPPPIFERLGIKMTNAIVRNAKAKIIERRFKDVKERLSKLFPTYTGGNVLEKPENLKKILKNSDNIPTDAEFTQAVEDILEYYFNELPYSGAVNEDEGKTRMQVYNENLFEKRIASESDLNLMLMRSTRSQKVSRRGVHLIVAGRQIDYFDDELMYNHYGDSVYCRYDPEDLSYVRVYDLDDNYIATVKADSDAIGEYGISKDEIATAQRKVKNLEKIAKQELKATTITSLGKKTALELVLAQAEENKANREEYKPKVISIQRANEQQSELKKAVGAENDVEIDITRMIRNAENRNKEEL